jgi:diguanylate cyclase (GGDEF)-like protein
VRPDRRAIPDDIGAARWRPESCDGRRSAGAGTDRPSCPKPLIRLVCGHGLSPERLLTDQKVMTTAPQGEIPARLGTGRGAEGPADPLVAVGEALHARARDVAGTVLARWRRQQAAPVDPAIARDIVRTNEVATIAVSRFLTTGSLPTHEQAKTLSAPGKAPLRNTISLEELTRLYFLWRDVTIEVVREIAADLGVDGPTVEQALDVVRIGSDGSITRMARKFDAERTRMQAQIRQEQERLQHQALHDALTGLPNRLLFVDRLAHALDISARRLSRVGVLFVDLDRFKLVNDGAGHTTGDVLLQRVAARIREAVRTSDTVARFGGDEFLVLCEDLAPDTAEVEAIARRIAESLLEPFSLPDRDLFITASIGIAIAQMNDDAEAVLTHADRAMYLAKQRGRAQYAIYDPQMDHGIERRADLVNALHRALERAELTLHYQPVADLDGDVVRDREALLRWNHPMLGSVPPGEFIPLAEESGLIREIGSWVIMQACRDCARWQRGDSPGVGVSINISGRQLEDGMVVDVVRRAIAETGIDPSSVTLELTESILFGEDPVVSETLDDLRALGVRLAIDDFGTGYSSLSYLSKFPIDLVKIDRSFVAGIGRGSRRNTTIVFATIDLAHALGLSVMAEGVEHPSELAELRKAGCDAAQGFLLGRPSALRPPDEPVGETAGA